MAYYGAIPVRSGVQHTVREAGLVSVRNDNGFAARQMFLFRDFEQGDPQLLMINAASSTGRCNTIQRIDSAMLPQENRQSLGACRLQCRDGGRLFRASGEPGRSAHSRPKLSRSA